MLYQVLCQRAFDHADKIAVTGETHSLTYSQLFSVAGKTAAHLTSLGLKAGDPILVGIPPSPDFYVAFYGASALGLVILPVLPSGKVAQVYQEAKPLVAVGDESFLAAARERCNSLRHCIAWTRSRGLALPDSHGGFDRNRIFREETILGVSSSGTTGQPKLHLRSAELVVYRAKLRAQIQTIQPEDVFLASRPFNSGSAINSHVVLPILVGGRVVVHERFERFRAAEAITKEQVTVLYAVPFIFELLASIPDSKNVDFSSLRLCISGSAPLSSFVAQQFQIRFGITIRQRYSGSHFHPAFAYNLDGPPDSVGRVNGFFPIVIVGDAGSKLGPGAIGEIAFCIAGLSPYLRSVADRNQNRKADLLYTGDLGKADESGNVYVVGRKSFFIKVAGNRVEPAEVEDVLRSYPGVKEALAYGLKPGQSDEAVGAIVVVDGKVSRQDLARHCASRLDAYKCPRKIEFRDSLPRSEHGKVLRRVISAELGLPVQKQENVE